MTITTDIREAVKAFGQLERKYRNLIRISSFGHGVDPETQEIIYYLNNEEVSDRELIRRLMVLKEALELIDDEFLGQEATLVQEHVVASVLSGLLDRSINLMWLRNMRIKAPIMYDIESGNVVGKKNTHTIRSKNILSKLGHGGSVSPIDIDRSEMAKMMDDIDAELKTKGYLINKNKRKLSNGDRLFVSNFLAKPRGYNILKSLREDKNRYTTKAIARVGDQTNPTIVNARNRIEWEKEKEERREFQREIEREEKRNLEREKARERAGVRQNTQALKDEAEAEKQDKAEKERISKLLASRGLISPEDRNLIKKYEEAEEANRNVEIERRKRRNPKLILAPEWYVERFGDKKHRGVPRVDEYGLADGGHVRAVAAFDGANTTRKGVFGVAKGMFNIGRGTVNFSKSFISSYARALKNHRVLRNATIIGGSLGGVFVFRNKTFEYLMGKNPLRMNLIIPIVSLYLASEASYSATKAILKNRKTQRKLKYAQELYDSGREHAAHEVLMVAFNLDQAKAEKAMMRIRDQHIIQAMEIMKDSQ